MGKNALRSQIVTLKRGQHSKYLSFTFTEEGMAIVLDSGIHIQKGYEFTEDITNCDIQVYVCVGPLCFLCCTNTYKMVVCICTKKTEAHDNLEERKVGNSARVSAC